MSHKILSETTGDEDRLLNRRAFRVQAVDSTQSPFDMVQWDGLPLKECPELPGLWVPEVKATYFEGLLWDVVLQWRTAQLAEVGDDELPIPKEVVE